MQVACNVQEDNYNNDHECLLHPSVNAGLKNVSQVTHTSSCSCEHSIQFSIRHVSHKSPSKLTAHIQVNDSIPSTHVPPFKHTFGSQLSIIVSQKFPVKSGAHTHSNELIPSTHSAPLRHCCGAHSSMFVPQSGPSNPSTHWHTGSPNAGVHVPPFWQTSPEHGSTDRKRNIINIINNKQTIIN